MRPRPPSVCARSGSYRSRVVATALAVLLIVSGCGSSHTRAQSRHATAGDAAALARIAATGQPVYCGGSRPYAALTFDDGPGVYTPLALRILRAAGVRATFFLVGRNLARFPALPRLELAQGALGDHTWTHPFLPALDADAVASEVGRTSSAIRSYSGAPVTLFRPPYGGRSAVVDQTARRLGLIEVMWSVDSRDSLGADYLGIAHNVEAGLRPGAIVLMHENRGQTIRALKFYILPALRSRHLHLVTVPDLLALDPPSDAQLHEGPAACPGPPASAGSG